MEDIFLKYLSTTLNVGVDSLTEGLFKTTDEGKVLQDNALAYLNTLHANHIETVKSKETGGKTFDEGFKAAQSTVLTTYEKKMRKRLGITEALEGEDLWAAIVTSKDVMTDEQKIKNSPIFLAIEREVEDIRSSHEAEKLQIVEQFKAEQKRAKAVKIGQQKAREIALSMNPVLPANATVAERNLNTTLNTVLAGLDFNVDDSGNVIGLLKDGARYENQHGHPYTIDMLLKEQIPTYYELRAQADKGNGGNQNTDPGPGTHNQNPGGPKTKEEFDLAIRGKNVTEIAAIATQYQANLAQT